MNCNHVKGIFEQIFTNAPAAKSGTEKPNWGTQNPTLKLPCFHKCAVKLLVALHFHGNSAIWSRRVPTEEMGGEQNLFPHLFQRSKPLKPLVRNVAAPNSKWSDNCLCWFIFNNGSHCLCSSWRTAHLNNVYLPSIAIVSDNSAAPQRKSYHSVSQLANCFHLFFSCDNLRNKPFPIWQRAPSTTAACDVDRWCLLKVLFLLFACPGLNAKSHQYLLLYALGSARQCAKAETIFRSKQSASALAQVISHCRDAPPNYVCFSSFVFC